jgi:hypothetical protein
LPDAIIIAIPTLSSALNISKWANDRKIPIFIDIIDPWPDSFFLLYKDWRQFFLKLVLLPMSFRIRQILKHVNGAVAISNAYCQWAESISPKKIKTKAFYPSVNFNEIRKKQNDLKSQYNTESNNDLHLIYAGSFAISYDIPCILDSAKILYKKVSDSKHIRGKRKGKNMIMRCINRRSMIASCVFYACKMQKEPRSPKEIADIYDLEIKHVHRGCRKILDYIDLNSTFYQIKNSQAADFIERLSKKLNIDKKFIDISNIILSGSTAFNYQILPIVSIS